VTIRWVRGATILFFLLFIVAVTWPGMLPGNRVYPLVLGLPFSMFWIASWVVLSFLVLVFLDRSEGRARRRSGDEGAAGGGPTGAGRGDSRAGGEE
jgi:hypothetical protein